MTFQPERVCKVTPNRIFSMSVHPMTSSLLVAAGDKWGAIGLWNVNDTASETHGVQVFYVSYLVEFLLIDIASILIHRATLALLECTNVHSATLALLLGGS